MIYYQKIKCPLYATIHLGKAGKSTKGVQRYFCKNEDCPKHTFMLKYKNKACELGIKETVIDMTINGSGIRDIARVLNISKTTIIHWIKKQKRSFKSTLTFINLKKLNPVKRLNWMNSGLLLGKNQINVEFGLLWSIQRIRYWHMFLDDEKRA